MSTDPTHDRMPMEPRTTTPESPSYAAASPRGELAELQAPSMNAIAEGIARWSPAPSCEPLGLAL